MALEQYNKKRRFNQTPEPKGKISRGEQHRFVVQKHQASRMHYDFRLEMDGVLKSWAVPKGPSLDPSQKRLAMQVEDHPVTYVQFEGIIPQGNYGAGTVMVWDIGTWEPLGDADKMLSNGDLKFRLRGKKLNGEFVLAKMRSRRPGAKGTEWLLIKKKDNGMQPGFDIEKLNSSALTNQTLDQIASDKSAAEWKSDRKARVLKGAEWLFRDDKKPSRNAKRTKTKPRSTSSKKAKAKKQPTAA